MPAIPRSRSALTGATPTSTAPLSPGALSLELIIQNHIPAITTQLTTLHALLSSHPPNIVELSSYQGKIWRRRVKSLIDSFRTEYAIMNKAFDVLESELGITSNPQPSPSSSPSLSPSSSPAPPTDSGWQYAATGTHPGWPWSTTLPPSSPSPSSPTTTTTTTTTTSSPSSPLPSPPPSTTATTAISGYQTEHMRRLGYAPISAERIRICQSGQQVILDIGAKVGKECLKFIEYRGSVEVKKRLGGLSGVATRCAGRAGGPAAVSSSSSSG